MKNDPTIKTDVELDDITLDNFLEKPDDFITLLNENEFFIHY
jgi:hypothetical protein